MKGKILRELRLENKLTQDELAKKLDVSSSTIRMIELGKRNGSDEVINKIANFFSVSLDYLNGRTTERTIEKKSKPKMIDDFLDSLLDDGIITDPNDIDDTTADMILNAIKAQVALKLKKREKGEK